MRIKVRFVPRLQTSWGPVYEVEGTLDTITNIMWIDAKRGIHLTSRVPIERLDEPTKPVEAIKPAKKAA